MFLSALLTHTPLWVFALFAVLIWLGARRLRASTLPLARVWTVPAIFIAWGLCGLFAHAGGTPIESLGRWIGGALIGGALGAWSLSPSALRFDHRNRLVRQPGSALPLLRNLAIFAGHYVLQMIAAAHPQMRDSAMAWDLYVSGFSAGFFIGWAIRFVSARRVAMQTDLVASAA
ncbi:DUF6622 family protein [Lysobacter sp. CA199]|uniref:DUF6622 family protein n=1 Tax=Lysobacter sp. CA199 TaxID=3455608 RepID=UPI003F8D3A1B